MRIDPFCYALAGALALSQLCFAEDSDKLLTIDHYVRVSSLTPAIKGEPVQLYVRELALAGQALRTPARAERVALFVHGAGTPAEVTFDVNYQDYSWMAYLAQAGFDVFSVDMTGYGRSTRPAPMNDPCNLSREQQAQFVPALIPAPCPATYAKQLATIASDWNDVGAVVDYVLALRHVQKVSMVAWSQGGPRAGGYAAQHPEKVQRLVLLAPAYNRERSSAPPAAVPAEGAAFNTQSHDEFTANWDRQVGCANQYEPAASEAVWKLMLESDPVGATWGSGVRRAPQETVWGFNQATAAQMKVPVLMISGVHDKQVNPERVRELYNDLASPQKIFVDLGCSSHNAMWEKNHLLLFRASLDWLTKGTVEGKEQGMLRLGY